ncbi:beta-glucosidase BglX [Flavobacterium sp. XS2P39]|uniref:beta-glucosidase BglX n=1 Tax=Flavobacterium sp. XS2P39 TaxID=3401725 RepID=UPI003AAB83EC
MVHSQSKEQKMNVFIADLMAKMTVEEKIGQLNLSSPPGNIKTGEAVSADAEKYIMEGKLGAVLNMTTLERIKKTQQIAVTKSRLKIPLLFGLDVIHGYKTIFPIPLGLSCTWNMNSIKKSAQIAASESSADGINWTFSPMVDISRDPRWGRVAEGGGEDPFLGSEIAKAMVKGYQGDDLSLPNTILACVKHYALYGAPDAGRDYNTVDMSRVRMYNEYFPPYKAAVEAGVGSVMTSFNEVDGIPASGNKWLMTEVLRNQWGFNGFVVTDFTAIKEMVDHGLGNNQEVAALALKAGTDMDMVGEDYLLTLKKSLEEGKVTIQDIDTACRRILEMKYKLGLFEDPFRYINEKRQKTEIFTKENRNSARNIAAESFVLMKNENSALPLKANKTIAVIGPLADDKENMPGTWSVAAETDKATTLLQGIKQLKGKSNTILYAKGANIVDDKVMAENVYLNLTTISPKSPKELIAEALEIAKKADQIVLAIGEASEMSGECSSRTDITIPENQVALLDALKTIGKPIVVVLFTGRPLDLTNVIDKPDAVLNVWFAGSEAGTAITDVLFGDVNPSGKLTTTFPRSLGQVPIFYNHKNTGRPISNTVGKFEKFRSNYLDERNEPLFPFGFGLSYTTFDYSAISLSSKSLQGDAVLKATITITNSGKYAGAETVQLYIRDVVGSITRPVKELKGFQKIFLKAGESKTITFDISTELLKFYNSELIHDWESGDFEIMIGENSNNVKKEKIEWTK